ncbi:MAG: GAF domain-containing sensor histidine kinase [Patescibacteria group bacterium]
MPQKIKKLNRSALRLAKVMPIDKMYQSIVKEAKELFGAVNGSIYLEIEGSLRRVYTTIAVKERVFVRDECPTRKSFDDKDIEIIPVSEFLKNHPNYDFKEVTHFVSIPLVSNNISIALLYLQFKHPKNFTELDIEMMKAFANVASLRIRNFILHDNLGNTLEIRDLFISLAIHELSTPITTLSGYINLAKKSNSKSYFDSIDIQLERILKIMKSLERFHQLKKVGTVKHKKFSLGQAISRATVNFRSRFPCYRLIIEEEFTIPEIHIKGDLYKITQVLIHIFENAAKFSKDITPIVVQIKKDLKQVNIVVCDKGQGIPKIDIKKVMNGHYKAGGHTQQGMGLGLYLNKIIVESHGGKINMKSKLGQGTKVIITLPTIEK